VRFEGAPRFLVHPNKAGLPRSPCASNLLGFRGKSMKTSAPCPVYSAPRRNLRPRQMLVSSALPSRNVSSPSAKPLLRRLESQRILLATARSAVRPFSPSQHGLGRDGNLISLMSPRPGLPRNLHRNGRPGVKRRLSITPAPGCSSPIPAMCGYNFLGHHDPRRKRE